MRVALDLSEGIASEKVWSDNKSGPENVQDSGLAENPFIGHHMRSVLSDSRHDTYRNLRYLQGCYLKKGFAVPTEDESYG